MYSMYKVISKMTKEDGVVYAVLSPEGVCEVVPEDDLKLLTSIGFSMTTVGGVPLSLRSQRILLKVTRTVAILIYMATKIPSQRVLTRSLSMMTQTTTPRFTVRMTRSKKG